MTDKPLFIPLKTEYFEAFKAGVKQYELRKHGPRWNENTCRVGRAVTLSKGYGKHDRLFSEVTAFERKPVSELPDKDRADFIACYGEAETDVAVIWVQEI